MNLDPVLVFLQSRGHGQIGKTLFRDHLPADAAVGVVVTSQTAVLIDPYTQARKGRLQIVARNTATDAARARMESIIESFGFGGHRLGNMKFFYIKAGQEPLVYPRAAGGYEASAYFDFAFVYTE